MKRKADGRHEPEGRDRVGAPAASLTDRYRELLDIQDEIAARAVSSAPGLTKTRVSDRLTARVPLVAFDDFFPAWELAEPVFRQIVKWAVAGDSSPKREPNWTSVDMGAALFRELATVCYNGDGGSQRHPQSSPELVAVVGACLKPFLQARSRRLMPLVDQAQWRQRICPVCGGAPDFSYLAKEEGARWLMCSRCDGVWLFQRLECPYCGTQDQAKLSYLTDHSEEYRLYVCDACHKYIKAVDMRRTSRSVRLPLERILTLDLDRQACASGYLPGP